MKTGQFLINPGSAIIFAAFLAVPMHSLAQSNASTFGGRALKPLCEYKAVMSDAEIQLCTGFRVRYNYDIDSGRAAAGASAGGAVQQATNSGRASRSGKREQRRVTALVR
jgi:hypothetical protein